MVNSWLIKMQSLNDFSLQSFLTYEQIFSMGAELSYYISNLVATVLNLTVSLEITMTKSCVLELCRFIELLKVINKTKN